MTAIHEVVARVAAAVEQAKKEAEADVAHTHADVSAKVARLQKETESVQARINEFEEKEKILLKEIHDLELERVSATAKIDLAIREQFEKAAKNSIALLSEITVLRPFLNASAVPHTVCSPIESSVRLPISITKTDATRLSDLKAAQQLLARNLQAVGLAPPRANQWSCEILAAALVGQAVSFRGSPNPKAIATDAILSTASEIFFVLVNVASARRLNLGNTLIATNQPKLNLDARTGCRSNKRRSSARFGH